MSAKDIKAVLLDIYGTVYIEGRWLPGARETIAWLFENNIQVRFITNTTLKNRHMLHDIFFKNGLDIPAESFFIPACAARTWLIKNPAPNGVLALVHSSQKEDMAGISLVNHGPADYVLVGDMGDEWNIAIMNEALHCLMNGATLMALQQNAYWLAADGNRLDSGAFVAALEFASGKKCQRVFGKPSELFFKMALRDLKAIPEQVVMVGDDYESDIVGAQRCGIQGVMLKTGKYKPEMTDDSFVIIDAIQDLPAWIDAPNKSNSA